MKISVRLVFPLLAPMGGLSLAGCSSAPETPAKIVEIVANDTMKYSMAVFEVDLVKRSLSR